MLDLRTLEWFAVADLCRLLGMRLIAAKKSFGLLED